MGDAEIDVIRKMLASSPRPAELSERRTRLDALGGQYPLPADVRAEAEDANGVAAEWTMTPAAEPQCVILFLHGGGYVSGSPYGGTSPDERRVLARLRSIIGWRPSTRSRRRWTTSLRAIASCYRAVLRRAASPLRGRAREAGSFIRSILGR